jgi:hypothetical protein
LEGQLAQCRCLVDYGADIEARDEAGRTPLMLATSSVCDPLEKALILLSAGANVIARDKKGYIALDHARAHWEMWKAIKPANMDRIQDEREVSMAKTLSGKWVTAPEGMDLETAAAQIRYDSSKVVTEMRARLDRVIQAIETRMREIDSQQRTRTWFDWLRQVLRKYR